MLSLGPSKLAFLVVLVAHFHRATAFLASSPGDRRISTVVTTAVSIDSQFADDGSDETQSNRHIEFAGLEPIPESSARQARVEEDERNKRKFVKYGEELWNLRKVMTSLSKKLVTAINSGVREREEDIREKLHDAERQDPELVYQMELEKLAKAKSEGRTSDAKRHSINAIAARSCLPHFNLDGLWVGKYGHHGYEMINVTYQGDTLIAYKVTGDNNVPRGEITFQADLSPLPKRVTGGPSGPSTIEPPLQPISLTSKAAKKWGTTQLPRYKGLGQVAEAGFVNHQWMDGQLIIIGEEYFSFAWVPIEQQIFFGRPSPELALKMLRESSAAAAVGAKVWKTPPAMDADVTILKEYVTSCLEKTTETVEDELKGDEFSCIWHGMDTEECYFQ